MNVRNRVQSGSHEPIFLGPFMNIHNHIEEIRLPMSAVKRLFSRFRSPQNKQTNKQTNDFPITHTHTHTHTHTCNHTYRDTSVSTYIDIEPSRLCAYLSFHCLSLLHQLADTESVSFPSPAHRIPSTRVPPHARDAFCSVCTSTHAPRVAQQINDPCTAPHTQRSKRVQLSSNSIYNAVLAHALSPHRERQ